MLMAAGNPYWAAEVMLTGMTSVPGTKVIDQECMMSKVLDEDGNLKTDNKGIAIEELSVQIFLGLHLLKLDQIML